MERKLSTIFATDVVGFSKMMGENEEKTLEMLGKRRKVIDGVIAEHHGNIFGGAGDSVIAEFASPVKATECAVHMQDRMQGMNENAPEDQQMIFRVGINIGDVMVTQDNLFGDAVNVAARLESAAHPAGICVSKSVFDMINQKIQVSFEDAGALDLKNISEPVQAYYVIQNKSGTRYVFHTDAPKIKVEKAEPGSLAVMLFKNLSNDEEQAYFCEGFSEDLVSALSRFRKLFVVSSNASFAYREKTKSPKEIGKELGIRYILEGSVRKLGPKMRIVASLISAEKENTIWSNNFDTSMDEIFDVHDELVETIVATIAGKVEADEMKQLADSRPEDMTAYDLVLKGLEHHRRTGITCENAEKALEYFEKAIEINPNYARAHAWRACSLANNVGWKPDEYPENWIDDCTASAKKALEIDPDDAEGHRIMGAIYLGSEDFELAQHHLERALELCPSDSYMMVKNASLQIFLGDPEKALVVLKRAMRANPFCSDDLFEDEGMCHFWLSDFEAAVQSFRKIKTPTVNSLFYFAAALQKKGDPEKSIETLKKAVKVSDKSVEQFVESEHYKDQKLKQELQEILESISV